MANLSTGTLASALEALNKELPFLEEERKRVIEERKKLDEQRKILDEKILKVSDGIKEISAILKGEIRESDQLLSELATQPQQRGKAHLIQEFYEANPNSGFTIPEIMKATGLPHGTIHGVMTRGHDGYRRDAQRRWWLDENAQTFPASVSSPKTSPLDRRPEYAELSIIQATKRVMENQPKAYSADDLSQMFYFIETREQLEKAKGTVSSELSRGVRQGFWHKVGKNKYGPLLEDPGNTNQENEELSEDLTNQRVHELVSSAVSVMKQVAEPLTPLHIDSIVAALVKESWTIREKEKTALIDGLTSLSEQGSEVYAGADDDTFGIVEQSTQDEEENDIENESVTSEGDAS